jgi:hypothetical protein
VGRAAGRVEIKNAHRILVGKLIKEETPRETQA